jgi:hypothetical protein
VYSYLLSTVAPAVIAAASMATTSPALAQCTGPGTQTSQGGDTADHVPDRDSHYGQSTTIV